MVLTGRYPHLRATLRDRPSDGATVDTLLDRVGLTALGDRPIAAVSGGEYQRAVIARALAQEPEVLLLDEPVANLDLRYQREIYELLAALGRERSVAIVAADHHVDLQAHFCDRMVLLDRGRIRASGTPAEVVTEAQLTEVFGTPVQVDAEPTSGRPIVRWRF